jgi:hypothetical protein
MIGRAGQRHPERSEGSSPDRRTLGESSLYPSRVQGTPGGVWLTSRKGVAVERFGVVESRRRFRRLLCALAPVLLMLATGCDDKDHGDDLNGAVLAKEPASANDCGEGPHPAIPEYGMNDVTMHWLRGTHARGNSATLYLCQVKPTVGTIAVYPSPGIQVSPTSLSFNATDEAILKIVVTVDSSAKSGGSIGLFTTLPDFTGPLNGPTIHIADERWSFDLPGRG